MGDPNTAPSRGPGYFGGEFGADETFLTRPSYELAFSLRHSPGVL